MARLGIGAVTVVSRCAVQGKHCHVKKFWIRMPKKMEFWWSVFLVVGLARLTHVRTYGAGRPAPHAPRVFLQFLSLKIFVTNFLCF